MNAKPIPTMKPKTKAETLEAALLSDDELAAIWAVRDAARIIINGKPFEPEGPISSKEIGELLNAKLSQPGNTVRIEFNDLSYCEISTVSKRRDGQAERYIEVGGRHA